MPRKALPKGLPPSPAMRRLESLLLPLRLSPLQAEAELTAAVSAAFDAAGVVYRREVSLAPGSRADFVAWEQGECIVLELKRRANAAAVRQVARYLACPQVDGLILVAEKTLPLGGVSREAKKPCLCCSVWQNWGVAV